MDKDQIGVLAILRNQLAEDLNSEKSAGAVAKSVEFPIKCPFRHVMEKKPLDALWAGPDVVSSILPIK